VSYDKYNDCDFDEYKDGEEWTEGECDRCFGGEPVVGPLGTLYCACEIGQGAAPEDCLCGPDPDES
jgi:hypothetical protein